MDKSILKNTILDIYPLYTRKEILKQAVDVGYIIDYKKKINGQYSLQSILDDTSIDVSGDTLVDEKCRHMLDSEKVLAVFEEYDYKKPYRHFCYFKYSSMDIEKIEELVSEFKGSKAYVLNGASEDEKVRETFTKIKEENGKIDGIVHAIAHANTEDLHNDFIYTSKEGFAHACDVSAYSFVLIARMAKELDMLNENASLITLTYHGSTKVLEGYNVMGIAKAALESSVRYLAENLGKENIRVNAVSAGPIKTLSAKGIKDFSSILNVVEQKAPLHRNVTTVQVGNVATFLLSSMSEAVTGQVVYADNGYNIMGV